MEFARCNTIIGSHQWQEGNWLRFSNIAVISELCPDRNVKRSRFLTPTDNYTLIGNLFGIRKGEHEALVAFEAVPFD